MTFSLKQVAVAAVAIVSFASAQAADKFAVSAVDTFTLAPSIVSLLSKATITATGTASFANAVLRMPASNTTLSNANATDLVTFASGAGLTIAVGGKVLSLSDFSYDNVKQSIDLTILVNGTQAFKGTGMTSTTAGVLGTAFDGNGHGALTSGSMNLTTASAAAVLDGLGLSAFVSPSDLTGQAFGTFTVTAVVPEPSTYALMGLGLVGVALAARKRKAA